MHIQSLKSTGKAQRLEHMNVLRDHHVAPMLVPIWGHEDGGVEVVELETVDFNVLFRNAFRNEKVL